MTRREVLQELAKLEPSILREYLRVVQESVGNVSIIQLEAFIQAGNIEGALVALGITSAALTGVFEAVRGVYLRGGQVEAQDVRKGIPIARPQTSVNPGVTAARFQFDIRNEAAEKWLRDNSSEFVTRTTAAQRGAIQEVVSSGTRLGRNPRQTALDIAGRIGPTGRRTGGIVGLADTQARYVTNAREELLSGDPERMRNYLTRTRRDKRFDGIVNRAIAAGRPVSAADINKITGRYSDRLLQTRANNIARTETNAAFNAAREQAWSQAIESGDIRAEVVTKEWQSSGRANMRDTHAAMDGQTVKMDEPFRSPSGAMMMHPGDSSLGAPAEEIINCACTMRVRVDHLANAA